MGTFVSNPVKGKIQWYFEQARDGAPDIGALLLITAGLQGDAVLADHASVAALLAASNDEATFTNYTRKTLPAAVVTVDTALDRVLMTITGTAPIPIQWSNAGGAVNNVLGKIVYYYDPAPGTSTDATRIPLAGADISATTDGTHLVISVGTLGIALARNPS
jgi:hypothetical protein